MHKLSYKTLLTVVVFLLIGIVGLLKLNSIKKVSAAWWNDSWNYRKAINVSNPGSSQTNSQIKILNNYDLSTLVTAGKIQSDLDDLRFTDINGTLLNYWIEDSTNNSADIWLILPTLPTSGATVYMYYGNSTTTGISSTTNMTIGGTMTSVNGYRIHTFNNSSTLVNAFSINAEVLVVAGGGGGASSTGSGGGGSGGGGAGGLIYNSSYSLTQNQTINVTVGIGGSSALASTNQSGTNGGNSIFNTLTATGGGGGARTGTNGVSGGSGGGAGYNSYTTVRYGGSGIVGVGNSGGNTSNLSSASGGGGGGAGSVGGDNKTGHIGGDGGLGISYSITGVGFTYSVGGRGGGGSAPASKIANTGYGGDGAYAANTPTSGASGIVVARFLSGIATMSSSEEVGGGPIAYWKFNEGVGNTAHDSTLNNHNGTIFNGTSWADESQCVSEKCLNFDGVNDYVGAGIGTDYFPMQTFSMCAWTKSPGLASGMSQNGIMSLTYGLSMSINGFGQFWSYMDNGTNIIPVTATSSSLYDNKFHHLCLTYDGTNRKMYIDGNLKNTTATTWTGTTRWPTNTVNIGHENNNSTIYKFNGLIDEPKIYRYALTDNQVKLNYNSRGSSKGSSVNLGIKSNTNPDLNSKLVAYFKFDEGNNTTANNSGSIGSVLKGTLAGTTIPTWTNDGKFGKALFFNGINSWVNFNNNSALNIPNDISISAWVNGNGMYISNATQYGAFIDKSGSSLRVRYWYWGQATGGWLNFQTNFGTVPFGQWSHIVIVNKPGNVSGWTLPKIYINGKEQVVTGNTQSNNSGGSGGIYIGEYSGYRPYNPFNGYLDEIKIYNSTLSDDEVKMDYNRGSAIQMGLSNQTIGNTTTSLEYCVPGDTSLCNSPVSQWNFEENTGTVTYDDSGNNNTGTFGTGSSAPTWVQGKIGSALNFDGSNDYIETNISSSLDVGTQVTLSAWIKRKNNGGDYESIANHINKSSPYDGYWIGSMASGKIRAFVGPYTNSVDTTNVLSNDVWHYVSLISNGTTFSIYVDGIKASVDQNVGTISTTGVTARIGRSVASGEFFDGFIDQVRIYNYARTPAQIAYDYNKGAPFAWWKFDECQGSVANNSSGIGNSGSITVGASGYQNSLGTCQVGTSATWTNGASGKYNGSLNFDGIDDYLTINNNSIFNLANTNHSFSLWFKTPTTMTDSPGMIFQRYSGGAPGAGYWIAISSNKVYYENRADGGNHLSITSINSYNDSNWHQVITTVDVSSKTAKMYIDGKYVASDIYSGNLLDNSSSNLTIGGQTTNYSYNGQVDDVRIYNYALTSEQIKTLYNNGAVNFN